MSEVEKMNEAMYERLGEIVKFASNKRMELDPDFKGGRPDDAHNRLMLAAFKDLRQMCEFYKPEEKEPIVPGCPSLMPRQLPGGFDGVEPAATGMSQPQADAPARGGDIPVASASDEAKAKLEASVERQREVLTQIESGDDKVRLFNRKYRKSCHGVYIYDRVCINGARLRATLHPDNGGLEQHATIWVDDSPRCFCYCTFNTTSPVKCDYVVRDMLAGLAKRLVYHHKNLIRRKCAAAAKAAAGDEGGSLEEAGRDGCARGCSGGVVEDHRPADREAVALQAAAKLLNAEDVENAKIVLGNLIEMLKERAEELKIRI